MIEGASVREHPVNGVRLHVAEAGEGPLVVLCHGWPELAFSWRHQVPALAAAGYRVAAPDMRGFGRSDAPADDRDAWLAASLRVLWRRRLRPTAAGLGWSGRPTGRAAPSPARLGTAAHQGRR